MVLVIDRDVFKNTLKKGALGLATLGAAAFVANRFMAAKEMWYMNEKPRDIVVSLPEPVIEEEEEEEEEEIKEKRVYDEHKALKLKELFRECMAKPGWQATLKLHEQIPTIQTLLNRKESADPDIDFDFIHANKLILFNLLEEAVERNIFPLAQLLLNYGADPNQGYHGTILPLAHNIEMAKLLLKFKAKTSILNRPFSNNILLVAIREEYDPSLIALYSDIGVPITSKPDHYCSGLDLLCLNMAKRDYYNDDFSFEELFATLGLRHPKEIFKRDNIKTLPRHYKTPIENLKKTDPALARKMKALGLEIENIYTYLCDLQQESGKTLSPLLSPSDIRQLVVSYLVPQTRLTLKEAQKLVKDISGSQFPELEKLDSSKLEGKK